MDTPYPRRPKAPQKRPKPNSVVLAGGVSALVLFVLAVMAPVHTGHNAMGTACLSRIKQLSLGMLLYNSDHEGAPAADHWMDLSQPYTKDSTLYHCPAFNEPGRYGYAMNDNLSGVDLEGSMDWAKVPMVYESLQDGKNAHDRFTSLLQTPRHRSSDRVIVGFADAHAKGYRVKDAVRLDPLPHPVKPTKPQTVPTHSRKR
jgi:hypothetical protein